MQLHRHVAVKVYVCVNMKHTQRVCSECHPCAQMQAGRCGCHCLTALSVIVPFQVPPAAMLPVDGAVCVNLSK